MHDVRHFNPRKLVLGLFALVRVYLVLHELNGSQLVLFVLLGNEDLTGLPEVFRQQGETPFGQHLQHFILIVFEYLLLLIDAFVEDLDPHCFLAVIYLVLLIEQDADLVEIIGGHFLK